MSERTAKAAGAAHRGNGADDARIAKARRNAWLLAGLAVFFYVGYMLLTFVKAASGG